MEQCYLISNLFVRLRSPFPPRADRIASATVLGINANCCRLRHKVYRRYYRAFPKWRSCYSSPEIPHCWYFNGSNTDAKGNIVNITLSFTNELLDRCSQCFPELRRYVEDLKGNRDALKYNGSQSAAIASILKSMCKQNEVERLSSFIRLLAVLPLTDNTLVVGKYKDKDRKQERLDMIRVFVACNAYRDIS